MLKITTLTSSLLGPKSVSTIFAETFATKKSALAVKTIAVAPKKKVSPEKKAADNQKKLEKKTLDLEKNEAAKEKKKLQKENREQKAKEQKDAKKQRQLVAKEKKKEREDKEKQEKKEKKQAIKQKEDAYPNRVLSPYLFFSKEQFPTYKAKETGKIEVTKIMKEIATAWKSLSADQRKPYQQLAEKDKERRKNQLEEYFKKYPKRPATPFAQYFGEQVKKLQVKKDGLQEAVKQISQQWKKLGESGQTPYKNKYQKAIESWKKTNSKE